VSRVSTVTRRLWAERLRFCMQEVQILSSDLMRKDGWSTKLTACIVLFNAWMRLSRLLVRIRKFTFTTCITAWSRVNSCSASQEIPHLLRKPKVHWCIQRARNWPMLSDVFSPHPISFSIILILYYKTFTSS
jgi:hypothetical protein